MRELAQKIIYVAQLFFVLVTLPVTAISALHGLFNLSFVGVPILNFYRANYYPLFEDIPIMKSFPEWLLDLFLVLLVIGSIAWTYFWRVSAKTSRELLLLEADTQTWKRELAALGSRGSAPLTVRPQEVSDDSVDVAGRAAVAATVVGGGTLAGSASTAAVVAAVGGPPGWILGAGILAGGLATALNWRKQHRRNVASAHAAVESARATEAHLAALKAQREELSRLISKREHQARLAISRARSRERFLVLISIGLSALFVAAALLIPRLL